MENTTSNFLFWNIKKNYRNKKKEVKKYERLGENVPLISLLLKKNYNTLLLKFE